MTGQVGNDHRWNAKVFALGIEQDGAGCWNASAFNKAKNLVLVRYVICRRELVPISHEPAQRSLPAASIRAFDVEDVHARAEPAPETARSEQAAAGRYVIEEGS